MSDLEYRAAAEGPERSEPDFERMRVEGYVCPACEVRVWPAPARASTGTGAGTGTRDTGPRGFLNRQIAKLDEAFTQLDLREDVLLMRETDSRLDGVLSAAVVAIDRLRELSYQLGETWSAASVSGPPAGEPDAWLVVNAQGEAVSSTLYRLAADAARAAGGATPPPANEPDPGAR